MYFCECICIAKDKLKKKKKKKKKLMTGFVVQDHIYPVKYTVKM